MAEVQSFLQAAQGRGVSTTEWWNKDIDLSNESKTHYAGRLFTNTVDTAGRMIRDTGACGLDIIEGTLANTLYLLPIGKVHEGAAKAVAERKELLNSGAALPTTLLDRVITLNPDATFATEKNEDGLVTTVAKGVAWLGTFGYAYSSKNPEVTQTFTKAAHARIEEKLSAYDPGKAEGWGSWTVNQVAFRAIAAIGLVYSAASRTADSVIGLANYVWAAVNLGNNAEANRKAHDSLNILGVVNDTFKFVERMIYANEGSIKQ